MPNCLPTTFQRIYTNLERRRQRKTIAQRCVWRDRDGKTQNKRTATREILQTAAVCVCNANVSIRAALYVLWLFSAVAEGDWCKKKYMGKRISAISLYRSRFLRGETEREDKTERSKIGQKMRRISLRLRTHSLLHQAVCMHCWVY
jgi:hypothetical protein